MLLREPLASLYKIKRLFITLCTVRPPAQTTNSCYNKKRVKYVEMTYNT